ncbi:LysR family transcriptional regulator [Vibrio kagoshimensis]|uniref:LysR family transcriptional regulator n=1 Tax=Vibrio kagoshimensis TaxID=2910244 RepID=UPI003D1E3BF8
MKKLRQMMVFMKVVESGSITKAAEKLELSKSVVSQHIKQLESDLDVTLLKRTTRKQSLTSEGERFYEHCCAIHQVAEQAWDEVKQQQIEPRGKLKITASHALMDSIVVPALSNVFKGYPNLSLEFIGHDTQLDLMQEDIDLAIRIGESPVSNLKQRRIGSFVDVLCCSKNEKEALLSRELLPYVANNWQPKNIEHKLFNKHTKESLVWKPNMVHRSNTVYGCISMIKQGLGVGILPDFIFNEYADSFIEWLPEYQLEPTPVYVLHPYSGAIPSSVKMAIEAITRYLNDVK